MILRLVLQYSWEIPKHIPATIIFHVRERSTKKNVQAHRRETLKNIDILRINETSSRFLCIVEYSESAK